MRLAVLALVVASAGLSLGCGSNARHARATEALEASWRVVTETEAATSGGEETSDVRDALADATARLEETQHGYDLWGRTGGSLAFEHGAACLSVALGRLREALERAHAEVSVELETTEATMAGFTERPCGRR